MTQFADIHAKAKTLKTEAERPDNLIDLETVEKITDAPAYTFAEVEAAFRKLLVYEDFHAVKVLLAAYIANFLPGSPVWLFMIAPSSTGKTEFINALDRVRGTYMLSLVTPNTFLSGLRAGKKRESSLLLRLPKQFIFLQKDFTSILNMRSENKADILGQLREIYDGKFVRETGEGSSRSWTGKCGFIAGCTPEIEHEMMASSKFGDRFLYYRLPQFDTTAAMQRVSDILFEQEHLQKNIQRMVAGYLTHVSIPAVLPALEDKVIKNLQKLMNFTVKARAAVTRDVYGSKEVQSITEPEGPTRFYRQLLLMGKAFMIMNNGPLTDTDFGLLAKIAFNSIPSMRMRALSELYKYEGQVTTSLVSTSMGLPTNTTRRLLEDLECQKLVERTKITGMADKWLMPDEIKELMAYSFNIDGVQAEKLEAPEEPGAQAADLVNKGWDIEPPLDNY